MLVYRLFLLLLTLRTLTLYAKFYPEFSSNYDLDDQVLTDVYWSDKVSYSDPARWQALWLKSLIGYKGSYSSFNYRRYQFLQEIKFYNDSFKYVHVEFEQKRQEDLFDIILKQRIKLIFPLYNLLKTSLMVEGGTFKKWLDYGASLSLEENPNKRLEFYFWLVDFEYNRKKTIHSNEYIKKTYTWGVNLNYVQTDIAFLFNFEYDSPLEWKKTNQDHVYSYDNIDASFTIHYLLNELLRIKSIGHYNKRNESKEALVPTFNSSKLSRNLYELDFILEYFPQNRIHQFGLKNVYLKQEDSRPGRKDNKHYEASLFSTFNHSLTRTTKAQYGLFWNLYKNNKYLAFNNNVKAQTSLEFLFTDNLFLFFNLTWKLDRIYTGLDRTNTLWGGGSLHLVLTL